MAGRGREAAAPGAPSEALRERTAALHLEAERTGIVPDILRARASRLGYALLLRNLLPVYRALETGLQRRAAAPGVGAFARPELYREPALCSDVDRLDARAPPLLAEGERYALRVEAAGEGDGAGLIGHAYARYFGDLSGGQILKRLLARASGLGPDQLAFYDFAGIPEPEGLKVDLRGQLDRAGGDLPDPERVVNGAIEAFERNIELSIEQHPIRPDRPTGDRRPDKAALLC